VGGLKPPQPTPRAVPVRGDRNCALKKLKGTKVAGLPEDLAIIAILTMEFFDPLVIQGTRHPNVNKFSRPKQFKR